MCLMLTTVTGLLVLTSPKLQLPTDRFYFWYIALTAVLSFGHSESTEIDLQEKNSWALLVGIVIEGLKDIMLICAMDKEGFLLWALLAFKALQTALKCFRSFNEMIVFDKSKDIFMEEVTPGNKTHKLTVNLHVLWVPFINVHCVNKINKIYHWVIPLPLVLQKKQ